MQSAIIKERESQAVKAIRRFKATYFKINDHVNLWRAEVNHVFLEVYWGGQHGRVWIGYDGRIKESDI